MKRIVVLAAIAWVSVASVAGGAKTLSRDSGDTARDYFTDLELFTHEGKPVRFYSDVLKGRVVLIRGFYTSCQALCPRQNGVLLQLQDALGEHLGRDVFIVSITLDPEQDTVQEIREYARELDVGPGWLFLTGKPENVNWLNHKLGQYEANPESHRGVYLLGNLDTGLWMKVPLHAQLLDLLRGIQRLLRDQGERGNE